MNKILKTPLLAIAVVTLLATSVPAATYTGGATFVVRDENVGQLLDAGGVLCRDPSGDGVGGACLAWDDMGGEAYVQIADKVAGTNLAFQVCVDNNGDGLCGDTFDPKTTGVAAGVDLGRGCRDTILFSHDDDGNFFNPLGPMPLDFPEGCEGGFPGWVVFLCEGVHDDGNSAHQHAVTTGSATPVTAGSGSGNFCGGLGELNIPPKPYVIVDEDADAATIKDAVADALRAVEDAVAPIADLDERSLIQRLLSDL